MKNKNLQERIIEWKRLLDKSNDMQHVDRTINYNCDPIIYSDACEVYRKYSSNINKASLGGKDKD